MLTTIKPGQAMTVLIARDGRWLRIRVSGRTGWIPRSKGRSAGRAMTTSSATPRRRPFADGRGTKRGFGGEGGPDDRVGADAAAMATMPRPATTSPARTSKADKGHKPEKTRPDDDKPRGKKPSKADADARARTTTMMTSCMSSPTTMTRRSRPG